jgi:hypothetical protein
MWWTIIKLLGGVGFLIEGLSIALNPGCESIDLADGIWALSLICYPRDAVGTGAISGSVGGAGLVVISLLLLASAANDLRRAKSRRLTKES